MVMSMRGENPMAQRSKLSMARSLLRLMQEKDYRAISIQEICAGADLARQTFYTNFASKDAILEYYLDDTLEKFKTQVVDRNPGTLDELLRQIFVFCKEHGELSALFYKQQLSHLVWQRLTVSNSDLRRLLHLHGEGMDEEQDQYLLSFFGGALYGVAYTWMASGMRRSPEEMAALTAALLKAPFPALGISQS